MAVMVPEGTGDGWGTEEVCLERGIVSPEARARGENRKQQRRGKGQQGTRGAAGEPSLSPHNKSLWQEDYFRLIIFKQHRRSSDRSDPFEKSHLHF